jgi:hypothetical protein
MVIISAFLQFQGIADFIQLDMKHKPEFHKLERIGRAVLGSFSPPEFLPTGNHKPASI